jgi:hypothetical protein
MADVAKLLVAPVLLTSSAVTLYTAPAGVTAIVRNIHVNNTSASAYGFSLGLNGTPATLSNALYSNYMLATNSAFDWSGFLVVPAGQTLVGLCSASGVLNIVISGVESS